jgi:riboflavin kinase / FMN adenylyltransferase
MDVFDGVAGPVPSAPVMVLRELAELPPVEGTAVTIGFYGGVHRGHQEVIARVRRRAAELGVPTAVVTFDRHPASVVRPGSAPLLLCDLDQKLELFGEQHVDYVFVVAFDDDASKEEAEAFVRRVLVEGLRARLVAVGEDFHFGRERHGNVPLLERMGARYGFEVTGLSLVGPDGAPARDHVQVSSTAIRRALANGDLERANTMLTRPYEVRGVVVEGDKRGRLLGFPTANVAVNESILLPADGVYAGWYVRPDGHSSLAAICVGTRPTFYDDHGKLLVEAHLLDFDGDLYGERARVQFAHWMRDNRKMPSIDALIGQLSADVAQVRELFGVGPDPLQDRGDP